MGLGTLAQNQVFKQKNRWIFYIDGVSGLGGSTTNGISALPPSKSARPNFSFKELEVQHVTETIYFPGKPDWKPVNLTLYDLKQNQHPVFEWVKKVYDPSTGQYKTSCDNNFKKTGNLCLYSGDGYLLEQWTFENAWPQMVEFGDLDMGVADVITCEITLRYDRAYISYNGCLDEPQYTPSISSDFTQNNVFNFV